jgi:hypothetical protein
MGSREPPDSALFFTLVTLQVFAFQLLSLWRLANLLYHDPVPVWTVFCAAWMNSLMVVSSSTCFTGTQFTGSRAQRPLNQDCAVVKEIVCSDAGLTTFDQ